MNYKQSIRALFEAVLLEVSDPVCPECGGRSHKIKHIHPKGHAVSHAVKGGKSVLVCKNNDCGHERPAGKGYEATSTGDLEENTKDPRKMPGYSDETYGDTHRKFMDDDSQYPRTIPTPRERAVKRGLASKSPKVVAKAKSMQAESVRNNFSKRVLEALEKEQMRGMKRDQKYMGGPAEKQLYQAKPGQVTPEGKKQLQQAALNYAKNAGKKAR